MNCDNFKKLPLTKRMAMIVSMVDKCNVVFDIACDHGYVGMAILQENKAKKVVFSDIKEGPLSQAKINLEKYCINITDLQYDFRIGDGLNVIKNGEECDTIIIAGIGYDVMIGILENVKSYNIKFLILSVHSKQQKFKEYLQNNNFNVIKEEIIIDKNKIYYIQKIKLGE